MSKKKEETVNELPNEEIINNEKEKIVNKLPKKKDYNGDLRGFKTLEEAINYPNTDEFKKLDIGCRTEYSNWLKNILEEE